MLPWSQHRDDTKGIPVAHFNQEVSINRHTPREWLTAGSQIGRLVNDWANRSDLVAFVGDGAGQGIAPALYNPAHAEVEVNVGVAFGKTKPHTIGDLQNRTVQFDFPKAAGAIYHEAMHAKHSTWDLVKAAETLKDEPSVLRALHLLEESRIERLGVTERPENRPFLRACALDIVLADMDDEGIKKLSDTRQAAHMAALSLARVDAGVLKDDDVLAIKTQITTIIPDETMDKLQHIWRQFQGIMYPEYDTERMYTLAREWDKIVQDQAKENGEPEEGDGDGSGGKGEPGEGGMSQAMKDLMDALSEDAEATETDAQADANQQQKKEENAEKAAQQNKAAQERNDAKKEASKVFGQGSGPAEAKTNSTLAEVRNPTAKERAAAVQIAKELERARYRDREARRAASVIPPGRLRTRAVIEGTALQAQGIFKQTEPFKRTQRKRVEDPKLTVGLMVDISGSMSAAMQPLAVSAWVMSEATRRVQATIASVYYGYDVFPTLKPGQHFEKVNVYTAPDGTEKFDRAFKALDGQLNLLTGKGARLLVVCSDGQYTPDEQTAAQKWLTRCQQSGVGVLWISYPGGNNGYAKGYCKAAGANHITATNNVTDAAIAIGHAAAEALTRAGRAF